ncbi:MAG: hypothetical protein ACRBN8_10660 [Nannocystales bacterium]
MMVSMATQDAEPAVTSVLGLRSEDSEAGERLTTSLRSAFAERDMAGGQDLTLEEVILTLDCSSEEDTACMTEAGSALEAQKLVYGSLDKSGGSYVVEISVLNVTTGQVEAQGTLPFDEEALTAANVDATAVEVVNSLYPQADTSVVAATPLDGGEGTVDNPPEDSDPPRESNYVWGPYKPRPTWKKVGLGVSASLTVLGATAGVLGWWYYKVKHESRITEAKNRNGDAIGNESTIDYCRRILKKEEGGEVDDLDRSYGCQSFVGGRNVNNAGVAVAVVAGISTVVFTTLMFVHKKSAPGSEARKPARFRLSGGPTRGGAFLGGEGRF